MENSKIPRIPLLIFGLGALVCAGSFTLDDAVTRWMGAHQSPGLHHAARFFTRWGDFPPIVAALLILFGVAWLRRKPVCIRILILMLGSAVTAGLAANILRFLTGRARPSARVAPGWYWMRAHGKWIAGSHQYSSFPSAHTAVAIACVAPLWICLSGWKRVLIAGPATVIALCIAGSRIALDAHHLSDVLVSVWIGALLSALICTRFSSK